jgi:hypothetical protein
VTATCSLEHILDGAYSKAIPDLLDELEASRASRKRAWEILQEIRWVLKEYGRHRNTAAGKEDDRS